MTAPSVTAPSVTAPSSSGAPPGTRRPALAWVGDARTAQAPTYVLPAGSLVVSATTVLLTVGAWHGHPRGRIALMLATKPTWDMARMSAVGLGRASSWLLTASGPGVLALLVPSSRECPLWERARKAGRRAARAGSAADPRPS